MYASRSLTDTERRYAQIEKEGLAATWACERFAEYILGLKVKIKTDHKPLVPIFGSKHLDSLPPRMLRFRLRMDRFNYTIEYVPGKELYTADTLSRAPVESQNHPEDDMQEQLFAEMIVTGLPASADHLETFRQAQQSDPVCSKVQTTILLS